MSVDPKKIKILLVEDAAVMRKIEIKTLREMGFEHVTEAVNGDDAIAKLENGAEVDLIISDWNMPEKDGFELLVWIRANDAFSKIPFMMATGQSDKKKEQKAIDAGVSSFVTKPFAGEELRDKIEEAFGFKSKEDEPVVVRRPARKTSGGKVPLKVAHIQITDHLVLGALKHLIDNKELKPKYFDLEVQCMPGWNPVKKSLETGAIDGACILAPIAMDLFNYNLPIKLTLLAHKSGSIFVRNRSGEFLDPYKDFFRDKSFYIPHMMSVHHMLAHMFFSKIGLKPGLAGEPGVNVNFEVVAPIKMPEFLGQNPNACGFMVAEPLGTKAIANGIANLQFLSSELWDNHPCCVVAMRNDFIEPHEDAVYEFTEMLVSAGQFISKKPELAAEVAVKFLDPSRQLGLKVPILKNVLTEARGIKADDLYPVMADLDQMQRYMSEKMGIGAMIDLEKFVDLRFADQACQDRCTIQHVGAIKDSGEIALSLLNRGEEESADNSKANLALEGKYLTFEIDNQEYGIDILKIKEIIGLMPIRSIPQAPTYIKGVINLRGKVIPVMDLRAKFEMSAYDYDERSCIIVLELEHKGRDIHVGITVDSVSEVLAIKSSEIEEPPNFGVSFDSGHLLAMARIENSVKILLDVERIFNVKEIKQLETVL